MERVPGGLQEVEGAAVVFFQGAGPGGLGFLGGLLERLAFEDEGGELDGLVGGVARRRWMGETSPAVVFRLTTYRRRFAIRFASSLVTLSSACPVSLSVTASLSFNGCVYGL